jgi:fructokinase
MHFMLSNSASASHSIVCFGEILWDVLPNAAFPGGAPMNVAYHLKKLHYEPQLITRVGHDEWGKGLIQLMERHEISTEHFQMDHELDTGRVIANVIDKQNVTYEILNPVAWDNIQWETAFESLLNDCDCFVFGSLSARNQRTRNTLFQSLELAKTKVLDINLRPPFYSKEVINDLLLKTDLLKLNKSELEFITGWFAAYNAEEDRIRLLQEQFHIPTIVVTNGDKGAVLVNDGTIYRHNGFKVEVADTIGSGDAFLAGLLSYLLKGKSFHSAIEYANALGALIASLNGGCPEYDTSDVQLMMDKKLERLNI